MLSGSDRLMWPSLKAVCPSALFQCNNNECILPMFQCDAYTDCSDGSDENNCGIVFHTNYIL